MRSVTISQNKARTAARYRRPTQIFNNVMQTPAGAYIATLESPQPTASPGGYSACRGQQEYRCSRLQRRDRRPGCGGLQGRRGNGEVVEGSDENIVGS